MRWDLFKTTIIEEIEVIKKFNYITDGRVDAVDAALQVFVKIAFNEEKNKIIKNEI